MTNNTERIKQFLVIAATVGVLVFNWLAAAGYLGGIETGAVSDKYSTRITPAGYAFAIWSLIYTGLVAFSIYQALPSKIERFRSIRTIYILNCAVNCAWLYFWHQEAILVCTVLIFLLLGTLVYINIKMQTTETIGEFWFAKAPFSLYFGWVTVAAILNVTIALIYSNVQASDSAAVNLSALLVIIATALGVIIRFKLDSVFYSLAIAWALTAIAVKQSGEQTLIVATAAVAVNILLIVALTFLINIRSSSNK